MWSGFFFFSLSLSLLFFFVNRDIMIASESSPVTRKCYLFVYKFLQVTVSWFFFPSGREWTEASLAPFYRSSYRETSRKRVNKQNKKRGDREMTRERVLTSSYSLPSFFVLRFVSLFVPLPPIWTPATGYKRIRLHLCANAIGLNRGYTLKPVTTPAFAQISSRCDDYGI